MNNPLQSLCSVTFGLTMILTAVMPLPAEAAGYLKIAGIEGESVARDHKNEIEIYSWSWGAQPPTATAATSGAAPAAAARATTGAGAVDPSPATTGAKRQHQIITFTKRVDKSSPMLKKANANHQVFPSVTLSLPDPNGSGNSYLAYELQNAMVSSYQLSGGSGADGPTETITFVYGTIH